jgi:xanthine dehydrogenase/oxidase
MCIPDENNTMRVQTAAQFTSFLQGSIAALLGRSAMDGASFSVALYHTHTHTHTHTPPIVSFTLFFSAVIIEPKKVGGSYGARITRNVPYSMLTAWAAAKLNLPVRMNVQFNSLVAMLGKRCAYLTNYKIGIDANGKLLAVQLDTYLNQGANLDGANGEAGGYIGNVDNAYYCPNWQITATLVKTNTPPCTSMRGPGWTQAVFVAEQLLEHVAAFLNQPADVIKTMNLYQQGQVTPSGQTLQYFSLPIMIPQIKFTSDFAAREQAIAAWNASNRWLKKGISLNLCKFGVYWAGATFAANIAVLADGSVVMTHSGIELGQGINTKVAQAAAMMLGIPMSNITVQDTTTTQMVRALSLNENATIPPHFCYNTQQHIHNAIH